jgi:hypothetical protein
VTTRTTKAGILSRRMIIAAVAMGIIALALGYFVHPAYAADTFTPGQNGAPTDGTHSDLLGGTANFTFEQDAVLSCDGDTATSFTFTVDYDITGTLPDGATLVVYLSPNQGAINNNGGSDPDAYIAAVESNYTVVDVGGLSGTGSFEVTVDVTSDFQLAGGGVLGVFASEDGGQSWDGKTNSLQCSEAQSAPPSAPESAPASASPSAPESAPASGEQSLEASGEQSQKAGEGTPGPSLSNGALFGDGSNPLPTILFSLILLASLGTLAFANVKTVRNRN